MDCTANGGVLCAHAADKTATDLRLAGGVLAGTAPGLQAVVALFTAEELAGSLQHVALTAWLLHHCGLLHHWARCLRRTTTAFSCC